MLSAEERPVAQNIYDNPEFFAGYSQLERSVNGLAGAAEWASLRALVPDLRGLRVVDLGCGFGWFCRWAREQGAAAVHGFDLSERMLARAQVLTTDPAVTYARADLERLDLPEASFDFAYSSLALHYVPDLDRLLAQVHQALVPGGRLVCSVEHPIFTAPERPGWNVDAEGRKTWALNGYQHEGPRTTDWLAPGVVKHHRTLSTYANLLLRQGFTLSHLEEWRPSAEQLTARPEWAEELERPMFLLLAAQR